ncbi:hypothetical protein GCM10010359_60210 [Streptomyces morookaense]|nr:hypothetical protein GCM10010359_60210 [Streptomyces morookaense]
MRESGAKVLTAKDPMGSSDGARPVRGAGNCATSPHGPQPRDGGAAYARKWRSSPRHTSS